VSLFPVLFAVYWSSVLVWFLMASRLRAALNQRHPLLCGTGFHGDLALMRFLLGRRDRSTDDRGLARLCGAMRTFLWVYTLFFLALPSLVLR
jgi:hypothetical protein